MPDSAQPFTMHLVINTHWDREWRWSFRQTQVRLVEALDLLLDAMERDDRFASFLADSQAAMIDDYLSIRPENRQRVRALIEAGRLFVGPWYTLPALFLVSGESIVRNLLIGHRLAGEVGRPMKAAYHVFSWGQISQLPQIYRQFGIDTIMFYRGLDQSAADRFEYIWQGPDGSRLLGIGFGLITRLNFWVMVYQPWRNGGGSADDRSGQRGFLVNLCDPASAETNHRNLGRVNARDIDAAVAGLDKLLGTLEPKSSTRHLLAMQGTDLEIPDPQVLDLVDELNRRLTRGRIVVSSIPAFFAAVRESLTDQGLLDKLPTLSGERLDVQRIDGSLGSLLPGVFSARMNIKLANHRAEVRLGNWAEPAAAWAMLHGAAYPRPFLDAAWKTLCQNQQHDGIGGCHVDRVTLATEERYREVEDISETVTRNALTHLAARVDASSVAADEVGLIVFNPHSQPFTGVVECAVDFPHAVVGIKTGGYRIGCTVELRDSAGKPVEAQVIEYDDRAVSAAKPVAGWERFLAVRVKLAFLAADVPPMGYCGYTARLVKRDYRIIESINTRVNTLENEHLRAAIRPDGTIDLLDKATGQEFPGLGYFENSGEEGGPLLHVSPKRDGLFTTIGRPAAISLVETGPLRARYRIEHLWDLPAGLEAELDIHIPNGPRFIETQRPGRSQRRAALRIVTDVSLARGSRRLEFRTRVFNTITDHRLRVVFPTGIATETHQADCPFDIVSRPIARPDSRTWADEANCTWPSQSFVDLSDGGDRGLAVLHAGVPEYEVFDDQTRSIALTLLRCFAAAGGVADTYTPQPLAQLAGEHEFNYAVHPHGGDSRQARLWRQAGEFIVPMRVAQCSAHAGQLPWAGQSFIKMDSADLVVTAVKQAEDGHGVVVRCFNPTKAAVAARVSLSVPLASGEAITLEEERVAALPADPAGVPIELAPGQIFSLRLNV